MVHLNDVGEEMEWLQDKKSLLNSENYSQQNPNNHQSFRQAQFKRQIANLPYDEQVKALRPSSRPFGYPDIFEEIEAKKVQKKKQQATHKVAKEGMASSGSKIPYKSELEQAFKRDFSSVKVHKGPKAKEANKQLGSKAYTLENHIVFGTDSPSKELVAHELTHTIQQRADIQYKGKTSESGDSYEQNANAVADRVVKRKNIEDLLTSNSISNYQEVAKKEEAEIINSTDWKKTNQKDLTKQDSEYFDLLEDGTVSALLDEGTIITTQQSINNPLFALGKGTELAYKLRSDSPEKIFETVSEIKLWQETFQQSGNANEVLKLFRQPILIALSNRANTIATVIMAAGRNINSAAILWNATLGTFCNCYKTAYEQHVEEVTNQNKIDKIKLEIAFSVLNVFTAGLGKSITTVVKDASWLSTKSPWVVGGLMEIGKKTGEQSINNLKHLISPRSYEATMRPSQMGSDLTSAFLNHYERCNKFFEELSKKFIRISINAVKSTEITDEFLSIASIDPCEIDEEIKSWKDTEKILQLPPKIPSDLTHQLEKGIWAKWVLQLRTCPSCLDSYGYLDNLNGEKTQYKNPGGDIEKYLNIITGLDIDWGIIWTDKSEFERLVQWGENWQLPYSEILDI